MMKSMKHLVSERDRLVVIYDNKRDQFRPSIFNGETIILTNFFRGRLVRRNGLVRLGHLPYDRVGPDGHRTRFRVGINLVDEDVKYADLTIPAKEIKPYYIWELGQLLESRDVGE